MPKPGRAVRRAVVVAVAVATAAALTGCAGIARSSQAPAPVEGTDPVELDFAVSGDGRYIAFTSFSPNLVVADSNGSTDVFVRDRVAGSTERVSVTSGGVQASGGSSLPAVSDDGRYVAFTSDAANLVAGDANGESDVFVRDRQLGITSLISVDSFGTQGNADSALPAVSDDGRYVAFGSNATNLVAGDSNDEYDIFVRDRQTNTTARVSLTVTGAQSLGNANNRPALSGDGRYVAFASDATDMLGAGLDTNNNPDIFVRDRTAATTSRVSVGAGGVEANNASLVPSISDNGRYVAFQSIATNLVAGDSNANWDIFVRDRQAAITERVSVASDESQGLLGSRDTAISSSGRYVVFNSDATNLVAGDTNSVRDVFLRDRTAGTTIRVSLRSDDQQGGGGSSSHPAVSENGDVIGFISAKTNLVTDDTNAVNDTFVRVVSEGTTERVSVASNQANSSGQNPAVSGDGRYVAFDSAATNLVARDTNAAGDVFVRDHLTGAVHRVSVTSGGVQANGGSTDPAISADGRYIAFVSAASNLVVGDTNAVTDIFRHDRQTGITERVSLGDAENQGASAHSTPDISDDGRYIVFATPSALNAGDANLASDIYRRDRLSNSTLLLSLDSGAAPANGSSTSPVISANGDLVAFASQASDLVASDTNAVQDIFRRSVTAGTTSLISIDFGFVQANGTSVQPAISDNGNIIAFRSEATNLVSSDTNAVADIFVRALCSPSPCITTTSRISTATGSTQSNGPSSAPSLSGSGRYVAFESSATNLVAGDTNASSDVFVRDRTTQRTSRVSTQLFLGEANGPSAMSAFSGDGRYVAFQSVATNLVDGDTNVQRDIVLRAQPVPTVTGVAPNSHADGGAAFPVTISGTNFLPGAQVLFSVQSITAVVNTVTDTTITATVTIVAGTPAGAVGVSVANPGTGPGTVFGTLGQCGGCFTVT